MELEKGVGFPVIGAGPFDDALQTPAVFRVDHDDHVAPADGLGDQVTQGDALAGLRGTHQQGAAFEVLQGTKERLLPGLDAMDIGQADLVVGLGRAFVSQVTQDARRQRELPIVDLGQLVEPLGMYRAPLEAKAQENLGRICAVLGQDHGVGDFDAAAP